jgi:uncharacterized membrane protein YdcZ (DUF606 family)
VTVLLVVGLVSVVAGALLAWNPLGMAKLTGHFGLVKSDPQRASEYRITGITMAGIGLAMAALFLLL